MKTKDPTEIDKKVSANIRRVRRAKDVTQKALADQIGITFQQVQKYEKGLNRVTVGRLVQISEVLDVDVLELLK